jgi:hypothetical protein
VSPNETLDESTEQRASRRESAFSLENTTVLNVPSATFPNAAAPAPPAKEPSKAVLYLSLVDFLSFMQKHQQICPNLQMTCPVSGVPLPSIDIQFGSTPELSVKVTFSLRLCEKLIQHVMEGR